MAKRDPSLRIVPRVHNAGNRDERRRRNALERDRARAAAEPLFDPKILTAHVAIQTILASGITAGSAILSSTLLRVMECVRSIHPACTTRHPKGTPFLEDPEASETPDLIDLALARVDAEQKAKEAAKAEKNAAKLAKAEMAANLAAEARAAKRAARAKEEADRLARKATSAASAAPDLGTHSRSGSDITDSDIHSRSESDSTDGSAMNVSTSTSQTAATDPASLDSSSPTSEGSASAGVPDLELPIQLPSLTPAENFAQLLLNKLSSIDLESVTDPAQKSYYQKHSTQLKEYLSSMAETPIAFSETTLSLKKFETELNKLFDETGTLENKLNAIVNLYNKLCLKVYSDYHTKLFDMIPFEGEIVSGRLTDKIFANLEAVKRVFAAQGIEIEFYLVGTACLFPEQASDIDIAAYVKAPKEIDESTFQKIVVSLDAKFFTSLGLSTQSLKASPPYTHFLETNASLTEKPIKVDLCFFNAQVEEHLSERGSNLSAIAKDSKGRCFATPEMKAFLEEGKVKLTHPKHPIACTEDRLNLLAKVVKKAEIHDLDASEAKTYITTQRPLVRSSLATAFFAPTASSSEPISPPTSASATEPVSAFALAVQQRAKQRAMASTSPTR